MDKIKVGILGYGNLGKGAEIALSKTEDMELSAIFTRRDPKDLKVLTNTKVVSIENLKDYKDKIDVILICGGSAEDLPVQSPMVLSLFNCVDSFDTHAKILQHFEKLDREGKLSNKLCALSIGWDPGLFSMARLLFSSIMPEGKTYTFWGKGVSQGHSDALRKIDGVKKAIQYTIPKEDALDKVKNGQTPNFTAFEKHLRQCFIVAKDGADIKEIENKIRNMPDYFKGYDVAINFISDEEFEKNHIKKPHGGFVLHSSQIKSDKFLMELSLKLGSNPEFTASVLVCYARAVYRMNKEGKCGAVTVFDIPLAYLSKMPKEELYKELL